jgi:hypothetical protein
MVERALRHRWLLKVMVNPHPFAGLRAMLALPSKGSGLAVSDVL